MSDKDKIREMDMALARSKSDPSYLDVARDAAADVMGSKTEQVTEDMFSEDLNEAKKSDDDDCDDDDKSKKVKDSDDDDDDDDDCDDDDDDDSMKEGSLGGAAKRHARAGHRDLNSKRRALDKASRNAATEVK